MKKYTLVLTVILLSAISYSQQSVNTNKVDVLETFPIIWTEYVTTADFTLEYKFINCEASIGYASQYIVLRLVNKSVGGVTLNWDMDLYYNSICKTCGYPQEYNYIINLEANETLEAACDLQANYKLKIFSKFVDERAKNNSVLTAFQLNNLSVTRH